jgi:hypothetical protein
VLGNPGAPMKEVVDKDCRDVKKHKKLLKGTGTSRYCSKNNAAYQ